MNHDERVEGFDLSGEAKWLSETFDWHIDQANDFVRGIQAATLRAAADMVYGYRDWYPTSVFPPLEEALSEGYVPTTEQVSAQMGRHCYGDVVPRNLRTTAAEIECGDHDEHDQHQAERVRDDRGAAGGAA